MTEAADGAVAASVDRAEAQGGGAAMPPPVPAKGVPAKALPPPVPAKVLPPPVPRKASSKASANFVCQSESTKRFTRRTANGKCREGSKKITI